MTQPIVRLILTFTALVALTGCNTMQAHRSPTTGPANQYDAVIVDAETGSTLGLEALADRLADTDVVVVGEYHGHHASHLLQARLQQALYARNPRQILTMEQFNLDHQDALDAYLADQTGETEMIEDAQAWDNYRGSYRPLVEFARQQQLPVVAANAPADIVRCIGRQGSAYLDTLPDQQRAMLPEQAFLDTPAYRNKFVEAISGSHGAEQTDLSGRLLNTYQAQLLRDNTMASRILTALEAHPGHQVLHTTGTFHSEQRLGTVAALEQRAQGLTISVISPVELAPFEGALPVAENRHKGDYLYFILPLPTEFRDPERQRSAMQKRFSQRPDTRCE
ncbi:ChaN family lipoprotein [Marinobacter sp. VGCF2001]|uniref:ChaN family lipoprotein n=1 Tax=Marinobacter sp. VGCF2001 TaxID=3417189 RepID=UPI003CFBC0D8